MLTEMDTIEEHRSDNRPSSETSDLWNAEVFSVVLPVQRSKICVSLPLSKVFVQRSSNEFCTGVLAKMSLGRCNELHQSRMPSYAQHCFSTINPLLTGTILFEGCVILQTLEISFCFLQKNQFDDGTHFFGKTPLAQRGLTKPAVETLARSELLHVIMHRYGIETIAETLQIRVGDGGYQVKFRVVPVGQDKDHNYRALLRKRGIVEVQTVSLVVACLPCHECVQIEEDPPASSDDNGEGSNLFEMALCNAIDQLLNHLACERNLTFGKWMEELCISDILIPSVAGSVNVGLQMLLTSPHANSGSCSQQMCEAILLNLGQSKVQELDLKERPLIQDGVGILLHRWFERSERRPLVPKDAAEMS